MYMYVNLSQDHTLTLQYGLHIYMYMYVNLVLKITHWLFNMGSTSTCTCMLTSSSRSHIDSSIWAHIYMYVNHWLFHPLYCEMWLNGCGTHHCVSCQYRELPNIIPGTYHRCILYPPGIRWWSLIFFSIQDKRLSHCDNLPTQSRRAP